MPRAKKTTAKAKKIEKEKPEKKEAKETDRYYEGIGRRKTAIARARIWAKGDKKIIVNGKPLSGYFPTLELQKTAISSLEKMKCLEKFSVSVVLKGGGISAQAEAMRHGLARALMLFNPEFRKRLKKAGFLKRDSRMKERKKPGLKKARRAPQWGKR